MLPVWQVILPGREGLVSDQNPTPPASRARVLVVDDSPTALYLLRTVFESEQYDVGTATDPTRGLFGLPPRANRGHTSHRECPMCQCRHSGHL